MGTKRTKAANLVYLFFSIYNGCTNLIDPSAVDSSYSVRSTRSVIKQAKAVTVLVAELQHY